MLFMPGMSAGASVDGSGPPVAFEGVRGSEGDRSNRLEHVEQKPDQSLCLTCGINVRTFLLWILVH